MLGLFAIAAAIVAAHDEFPCRDVDKAQVRFFGQVPAFRVEARIAQGRERVSSVGALDGGQFAALKDFHFC